MKDKYQFERFESTCPMCGQPFLVGLRDLCKKLVEVRKNENATFANQGQGMDGYSELANYRHIIDEMIYLKENIWK